MLLRVAQFAVALTLLALVAGAPGTAHAHGGSHHRHPVQSEAAIERAPAVEAQSVAAPAEHPDQHAHHPGGSNCCACGGGACQAAMMLPAMAQALAPPVVAAFASYDALSPPRRARASLEHPPKFFA